MLEPPALAEERIRPLKRSEYDRLVALGVFEDEPIELLYGALVEMSPVGVPHCFAIQRLTELLVPPLLGRATVRIQLSYAAAEHSEPQPDVMVSPHGEYHIDHPTSAWLVIEVAESSLRKDRGLKARLYAEAGVPEYWVVNLVDKTIEVRSDPVRGSYQRLVTYRAGESVHPERFPDVEVRVDDVIR